MRRTYKSKKDSGDGLDRRDLFQTVGDKSSVFDAFYIQNIKQAKRDLSREVSSNRQTPASHKVFKRKYIKRLGKDIQPVIKESLSPLAFLTPDKSIRVNKGHDLFDQLLNTSSQPLDTPEIKKKDSLYEVKSKTKKYKRKVPKKKYNYSDSDETDKENSCINENASQNTTDLRAHKLLIEKRNSCQIKFDESIKKIEHNLFMLQKNNRECLTNRLTTNSESQRDRKSPLSSTPFTGKFRNKSIYKFSPIKFELDNSNCTVTKENIDKFDNVFQETKYYKNSDNLLNSPILQSSKQMTLKYKENNTKNSFIDGCQSNIDYVIQQSSSQITKMEACQGLKTDIHTNYDLSEIPLIDNINIIQNYVSENHINTNDNGNVSNNNSNYISIMNNEVTNSSTLSSSSDNNDLKDFVNNVSIHNITIGDDSAPSQAFLGFTKIETDIIKKSHEDDTTKESKSTQSSIEKNLNNSTETVSEACSFDYDTCNSEVSLETGVFTKKPIVTIKKLSDNIFKRYYEKYTQDSCSDKENSFNKSSVTTQLMPKELNSDVESFENSCSDESCKFNDSGEISIENDTEIETSELKLNSENISIQEEITSSEDYLDSTSNEEEERCFVTTRKRNDFTGDCVALESSYVSNTSSAECEKTVLCQLTTDKNHSSSNQDVVELSDGESSPIISVKENSLMKKNCFSTTNNTESRKTLINTGGSSRLTESIDIFKMKEEYRKTPEVKPSIMLLPGKKWQRSLSIYRRLSMMVDPSDQSFFEDETLNKGRKYRQSVFSTIELQETIGSLNNSTIDSRRNTFVSKPCRSSIRIVKDSYIPRASVHSSTLFEDLEGFLSEDCDDTVIELSKLSIAEREKDSSVLNKVHDSLDRVPTARDYVFRRCNQSAEILFDECYPDTVLKNCRKIGEGVYGEVFLWRANDGRARVMKIVPIAGTTKVNGEPQKDYHEILSEIVIAMELSALRTPIAAIERHLDEGNDVETLDLHTIENATDVFNEVLAVRCVYGPYPSRLLDLWDLFDEVKGSENECPATLPADQHYLVLELANAGQDLESFVFNSAEQAYALFVQIAFGLAVAEEAYQFEHRDLHWGNVLISPTDQKVATFVLRCRVFRVARRGVAGAVIDYSLSRLALRQAALYNDLADDHSLFEAAGDYQFEVYRLMRDKLGNDWKNFEPYTNILWLHYTVDKMITSLRYKRTNTKIHKQHINKLKGIKNRVLDYGSAAIFVLTDNELLC